MNLHTQRKLTDSTISGFLSQTLQEVEVRIWSNYECRSTSYGPLVTDNMLCAGYKAGNKDSCQVTFFDSINHFVKILEKSRE